MQIGDYVFITAPGEYWPDYRAESGIEQIWQISTIADMQIKCAPLFFSLPDGLKGWWFDLIYAKIVTKEFLKGLCSS